MTVLSGSELAPAFMHNGQLTFTAEKATPNFYQLSGRRINWDLTDYHPLLAQRAQSDDTFGNARALGRLPAGDGDPRGAGPQLPAHPVGRRRAGRRRRAGGVQPIGGPVRGGAQRRPLPAGAWCCPTRPPAGAPAPRACTARPASLPDGEILASYAANVSDPARDVPRYDLVAVAPAQRRAGACCWPGGASSLVEATLGLQARRTAAVPQLRPSWCSAAAPAATATAIVHFPDLPTLATLLDANLRRGRNVAALDKARFLAVYDVGGADLGHARPLDR